MDFDEIVVTTAGTDRLITCSPDNLIRLHWDHIRVAFSFGEFLRLVQQTERVGAHNGGAAPAEVTFANVTMRLSEEAYAAFSELVQAASQRLDGRAPRVFALHNGSHPLDDSPLPYEFCVN
ncbi:MAG: hypothetical protein GYB64_13235 [Chloroflexi bacterium]|nr:hypothetical protein [Chloroflexota bacterium]